jgi:hypothetical protein
MWINSGYFASSVIAALAVLDRPGKATRPFLPVVATNYLGSFIRRVFRKHLKK